MKPEIFKPTNTKIGLNGKGMKYKHRFYQVCHGFFQLLDFLFKFKILISEFFHHLLCAKG